MKSAAGMILMIIGGSLLGLAAVKRLSDRTKILGTLVSAIDYLQAEIKYGLTALPDIMKKLAINYPELFFSRCAKPVTPDEGFGAIWKNAVKEARLPLRANEIQALEELGNVLGRFDADAQEAAIQLARERLQVSYTESRDEQLVKSRLFGFLGVGLGVVVAILLV